MTSLLGARIIGRGTVFGNLYLTDKQAAEMFDEEDERVLVVLATQAAIAVEAVLMLADIGPTGYEVGVLNGGIQPGDTVAVVGAGPIGLSSILTARLFSLRVTSSRSIWPTRAWTPPSSSALICSSTANSRTRRSSFGRSLEGWVRT